MIASKQIKNTEFLTFIAFLICDPFQDGLFRDCSLMEGGSKRSFPLPKTCGTYPAMMKRGTFIPYLIRIRKKHTSLTRPLISADISIFSPEMSNFVTSRIHI